MAQSDREKAVIKAFYDTMQKLVGSEKDLNGLHVKGIAQMQKSINETEVNTKRIKQQTLAVKASLEATLSDNATRIKSIQLNEKLIKLRNRNALEQIREQGEQVRRNIKLRAGNEKFSASLAMATKSLSGGFGFKAGISTTIQGFAQMTKKFNNLKFATEDLSKSHKKTAALKKELDQATVNQLFGTGTKQQTDEAEQDYQTSQQKTARNLSTVIDAENEKGVEQKGLKGVFSKLSGLGEFLNKKAVPIGIGMGVAGILVSIIVKSFSASPLFAQMMKMMKFMVTLILMPIGTFFGALLRPIMIMLLRKLIVPMFSTWMPKMMTAGTQVGTILSSILDSWFFNMGGDGEGSGQGSGGEGTGGSALGGLGQFANGELFYKVIKSIAGIMFPIKEEVDETVGTDEDTDTPTKRPAFGGVPLSIGGTGVDDGNFFGVDNSIPDAGHSKASDYDFDVNDVLKTADDEVLKAIQLGDYHEGERARIALEEEKRLAAEEAARQQVIKDEEERLAAVAENKTNYDNMSPERQRIADAQQAAKDANEKRASDNAAAISGEAPSYVPTYAEERQAEWDNMGGFSREDGGVNNQRAIEEDIAKRKQEKLETGTSGVGGLGEFAGKTWQDYIPAANGFDGMINRPTMFLAGEAGAEHVKVTPSGSGGGSNITVNIQNMNGSDNDLRKLKKTILEVIQQSSANRGRL